MGPEQPAVADDQIENFTLGSQEDYDQWYLASLATVTNKADLDAMMEISKKINCEGFKPTVSPQLLMAAMSKVALITTQEVIAALKRGGVERATE
ncbi:MAG: hypothetical protein V4469_00580 [Patescibacteria group bacterium]